MLWPLNSGLAPASLLELGSALSAAMPQHSEADESHEAFAVAAIPIVQMNRPAWERHAVHAVSMSAATSTSSGPVPQSRSVTQTPLTPVFWDTDLIAGLRQPLLWLAHYPKPFESHHDARQVQYQDSMFAWDNKPGGSSKTADARNLFQNSKEQGLKKPRALAVVDAVPSRRWTPAGSGWGRFRTLQATNSRQESKNFARMLRARGQRRWFAMDRGDSRMAHGGCGHCMHQ